MTENDKVLKVLRSVFLQTEVRVLYDLLYNLNNGARGNKTFRVLKQARMQSNACDGGGRVRSERRIFMRLIHVIQVEQCVNRLKEMKLDVALQSLTDLCPNRIQRLARHLTRFTRAEKWY